MIQLGSRSEEEARRELTARYRKILERLGRPLSDAQPFFSLQSDGSRHYEPAGSVGWDAVIAERGCEPERTHLVDDEAALYVLAEDVIFNEALYWEMERRIENQDPRHILFAKQVELMGLISKEWQLRLEGELAVILAQFPYRDASSPEAAGALKIPAGDGDR